MINKM